MKPKKVTEKESLKMPPCMMEELEKIDRSRWLLEPGSRHLKLKIDGRLIGVLPRDGGGKTQDKRAILNVRSQIRRHLQNEHR